MHLEHIETRPPSKPDEWSKDFLIHMPAVMTGRCERCQKTSCTCRGGCKSHADGHSCSGGCSGSCSHVKEMTPELDERYTREPILREDLQNKGPAAGKALTASELGLSPGSFERDPRYRHAYTQWVILREGGADGEPPLYLCLLKPAGQTIGMLKDFMQRNSGKELRIQAEYDRVSDSALVLVTAAMGKKLAERGFEVKPIEEYV